MSDSGEGSDETAGNVRSVHARYKGLREFLGGHMAAINLESPSEGYQWRPDRARAEEYVADFEMIAKRALRRPEWRGRLKLFHIYFLRAVEYRRAITLVGVAPATFDYWLSEVKKACGREFARTGLFPPGNYFRVREKSRPRNAEGSAPVDDKARKIEQRGEKAGYSITEVSRETLVEG